MYIIIVIIIMIILYAYIIYIYIHIATPRKMQKIHEHRREYHRIVVVDRTCFIYNLYVPKTSTELCFEVQGRCPTVVPRDLKSTTTKVIQGTNRP